LRPIIDPIFPPVTISIAITSVYRTIAVWIPVTVVPRSSATVAIETFITELSSAIRNCPAHSATSTAVAPIAAGASRSSIVTLRTLERRRAHVWIARETMRRPQDAGTQPDRE
jgi:hypothetical protein